MPVFPLSLPAHNDELSHLSPWWLMLVSAFQFEATARLRSQWVSVSPTSSSAKRNESQSRSTHSNVPAERLTMLCFAFFFSFFFNPCPDMCNDFVFTQVWHLVTAQDLQLLPWREKLPAEDPRGETTNRRPAKLYSLQLQRGSFDRVRLQAALFYKFGSCINKTGRSWQQSTV